MRATYGAAYAASALSVDVPEYVRGLWRLCEALGGENVTEWRLGEVASLASLLTSGEYDAVVVALGSRVTGVAGMGALPLTPCRGQNLILSNVCVHSDRWPDSNPLCTAAAPREEPSAEEALPHSISRLSRTHGSRCP